MAISNIVITVTGPTTASQTIGIVANSWKYDEGSPEKSVRAVVTGDRVEQDFSENFENAFSTFGFSVVPSAKNLDLTRQWELSKNTLTVTATGLETVRGIEERWSRTFLNASVDKAEKPMGADTVIEISGMSDAAT